MKKAFGVSVRKAIDFASQSNCAIAYSDDLKALSPKTMNHDNDHISELQTLQAVRFC